MVLCVLICCCCAALGPGVYLKHPSLKDVLHCRFEEEMVWQKISRGLCRGTKRGIASNTLRDTHICVPKRVTNSPWNKTARVTLPKRKNIFQTFHDQWATLGSECICLLSASNSRGFRNRCDTPCEAHFACHKVCQGVSLKTGSATCGQHGVYICHCSNIPWLHHTNCIKVYEVERCTFRLLRTILGTIPALKA